MIIALDKDKGSNSKYKGRKSIRIKKTKNSGLTIKKNNASYRHERMLIKINLHTNKL